MTPTEFLRNLSTRETAKCHRSQTAGSRWILVVEQSSHLARRPETWDGHVVGRENAGMQVSLYTAVSVKRQDE